MKKSKFYMFLLIAVFCLVFCGAALADQEGNDRWCNSDQYGCWITGDDAGQNYIMFWSESARDLFMGPESSAGVVTQYPAGKMPLDPAPQQTSGIQAPDPGDSEDPEEELTEEQKVEAIVDYVLENHLFDEENMEVTKELCDKVVEDVKKYDGFSDAVNAVYNMISENKDSETIGMAISSFINLE